MDSSACFCSPCFALLVAAASVVRKWYTELCVLIILGYVSVESVLCVQVLDSHHCDIKSVSVIDMMPHGTVDRYKCAATVGCCGRPEKFHVKRIPFKWRMCVYKI